MYKTRGVKRKRMFPTMFEKCLHKHTKQASSQLNNVFLNLVKTKWNKSGIKQVKGPTRVWYNRVRFRVNCNQNSSLITRNGILFTAPIHSCRFTQQRCIIPGRNLISTDTPLIVSWGPYWWWEYLTSAQSFLNLWDWQSKRFTVWFRSGLHSGKSMCENDVSCWSTLSQFEPDES